MTFHDELHDSALRAGMTMRDLAEQAGISRNHLHALTAGTSRPTPELVVRIADTLRTNPYRLAKAEACDAVDRARSDSGGAT